MSTVVKGKSIAYDGIRNQAGCAMTDDMIGGPDEAWDAKVKAILKAELKRKGVTYAQLVDKLAAVGVKETEPNIRNKMARGKFTAVFMTQVLVAIGTKEFRIN